MNGVHCSYRYKYVSVPLVTTISTKLMARLMTGFEQIAQYESSSGLVDNGTLPNDMLP